MLTCLAAFDREQVGVSPGEADTNEWSYERVHNPPGGTEPVGGRHSTGKRSRIDLTGFCEHGFTVELLPAGKVKDVESRPTASTSPRRSRNLAPSLPASNGAERSLWIALSGFHRCQWTPRSIGLAGVASVVAACELRWARELRCGVGASRRGTHRRRLTWLYPIN